ncbi:Crp/Fnr family transcriptional regulator [Thiohalocapsa sp. ML1]|uniref:Crp/Fnr family transcriptional regulator n=1 Tax=Thiohalocapsa sp. ML1 TaxID=1431688 RepID=UPI0007321588|nr:Crp/Fnr family transcriptional regulator [Thiohalocapsa sp. ML1]
MLEDLRNAPLLSRLTDEQLERVRKRAVQRRLDEGELLFAQGAAAERFYLVQSGQMRLFRLAPDGSEKVIEIVSPGQTFAEALMFLEAPRYPVSAAALAPTRLIAIDAADFAAMLRGSMDTCFVVMGALSQRLRALIGEIDELTLHSAKGRVARWLLARCPADRRALVLDVPKGVLASRLSIQPETFSRVAKQLVTDGVIEVQGAHVTVLDRDALARVAAD